jgi:hypothetical protein
LAHHQLCASGGYTLKACIDTRSCRTCIAIFSKRTDSFEIGKHPLRVLACMCAGRLIIDCTIDDGLVLHVTARPETGEEGRSAAEGLDTVLKSPQVK